MKSIYAELPPVEVAGTKLVGRVAFALLVLASALIGAFGGLLLVYSTDLPEIGELGGQDRDDHAEVHPGPASRRLRERAL